jgi:uncharacterized SAM-binding protein YcdF (DUF218 family)
MRLEGYVYLLQLLLGDRFSIGKIMFIYLSKLLPLFAYPIGLTWLLIILSLVMIKKTRFLRIILLAASLVLWISGNRWVSMSLVKSLEWRYLPPASLPDVETIVVLGGGTDMMNYPRPMVDISGAGDRVLYAAQLYKQGKSSHLLLSGGNLTWQNEASSTPASQMGEILEFLGIPADAIWLQTRSLNTYEDALYCSQILKEKGIDKILLVTSAIHMPRAMGVFMNQGIQVIPAPTDFRVTESNWADLWSGNIPAQTLRLVPNISDASAFSNAIKEYIGILVYRLRGWM